MGAVCISPRGCSFCWAVGLNANVQPLGPGDFGRRVARVARPRPGCWGPLLLSSLKNETSHLGSPQFGGGTAPVAWILLLSHQRPSHPRLWSRSILKGRNRENEVSDPQRLQFQKAPPPAFRVNSVTWERFLHSPLVNVVSDLGWVG